MKTTEIGDFEVSFRYTDEQGNTVRQELTAADRAYIQRKLEDDEQGKVPSGELTLHWKVVY